MDDRCLVDKLVYRAKVTDTNNNMETYTGLTNTTFKRRYYAHKSSFKRREQESSTTLSSHILNLKDKNTDFNIKWSVDDKETEETRSICLRLIGCLLVANYKSPRILYASLELIPYWSRHNQ